MGLHRYEKHSPRYLHSSYLHLGRFQTYYTTSKKNEPNFKGSCERGTT
jgi:hypothetical protein